MKKNILTFILSIVDFVILVTSLILLSNDYINMFSTGIIAFVLLFVFIVIVTIKKDDNKTNYNRELNKILKEYKDRIVYVKEYYSLESDEIVYVDNMDKIVNVSIKSKEPILFLNNLKECAFIVEDKKKLTIYSFGISE